MITVKNTNLMKPRTLIESIKSRAFYLVLCLDMAAGFVGCSTEEVTEDDDLITVPEVRNKTITEAEKILEAAGFDVKISTSNNKNSTVVVDQVPKPGVALSEGSIIMLYDQDTRTTTTVPDLTGKSKYQATTELKNSNLNISIEGSGTVVSQDPPKGSIVDAGTVVKVTLKSAKSSQ